MLKSVGSILLFGFSGQLLADSLGLVVGAQSWQAKSDLAVTDVTNQLYRTADKHNQQAWYLKFEHPIPLLPNVAVQQQRLHHQSALTLSTAFLFGAQKFAAGQSVTGTLDGRWQDFSAYYELADNDLLQLDVGATLRRLDVSLTLQDPTNSAQQQIDRWRPMLFADAELGILGTDTAIFAHLGYGKASSDHSRDVSGGLAWRWLDITPLQGYLKIGYQDVRLDLSALNTTDTLQSMRGVFAALEFDF